MNIKYDRTEYDKDVHMADMISIGSGTGRTACGISFYPIDLSDPMKLLLSSDWTEVTCKKCLGQKGKRWK